MPFVPPFSNEEVSRIRFYFREAFPADQYSIKFLCDVYGETSYLIITDVKHKIKFEVTTLRSPKEAPDNKTAKLVLMQRAVRQKDNNCLNPVEFVE